MISYGREGYSAEFEPSAFCDHAEDAAGAAAPPHSPTTYTYLLGTAYNIAGDYTVVVTHLYHRT